MFTGSLRKLLSVLKIRNEMYRTQVRNHLCNKRGVGTIFWYLQYSKLFRYIFLRFNVSLSCFMRIFSLAVDKMLWNLLGCSYRLLLWHLSVPTYDMFLLMAVTNMFLYMICSIFWWLTPQISFFLRWSVASVMFLRRCLMTGFVVDGRKCPFEVASCW